MAVEPINSCEQGPERIAPVYLFPGQHDVPRDQEHVPQEVLLRDTTVPLESLSFTTIEPPEVTEGGPTLTLIRGGLMSRREVSLTPRFATGDWERLRDLGGTVLIETEAKERYIEVAGGKLRVVAYKDGDPEYADLAEKVDAGQRRQYTKEGVWKPDADGTPIHGDNVEIVALLNEEGEPVTALRKVHARTLEEIRQLPSYVKFAEENAFDEAALREFEERAMTRNGVVEIAGLWKDSQYHVDTKLALFRAAWQDSIERGELWFMGVVTRVYKDLNRAYGEELVHLMCNAPIEVHDKDASSSTRLRALWIDPLTAYDEMMDVITTAQATGNYAKSYSREFMLWYFLEGSNRQALSQDTLTGLEAFAHNRTSGDSGAVFLEDDSIYLPGGNAVMSMASDAEEIITERLRAAQQQSPAIFTELDWDRPSVPMESPVFEAVMQANAIVKGAFAKLGLRADGTVFGSEVGRIAESKGYDYSIQKIHHKLPEADYRELLLDTATPVLRVIENLDPSTADLLQGALDKIKNASPADMGAPVVVTQVVHLNNAA